MTPHLNWNQKPFNICFITSFIDQWAEKKFTANSEAPLNEIPPQTFNFFRYLEVHGALLAREVFFLKWNKAGSPITTLVSSTKI